MEIDTSSEEWRQECWRRHLARVERLQKCRTQQERIDVFKAIERESGINVAREAWRYAFQKEADGGKTSKTKKVQGMR